MTTAMKFRVKDEEHSKAIQEKLFSLGYSWCGLYKIAQYCTMPFLFAEDRFITYDVGPDSDYFDDHQEEEYVLLNGELVPASSVENTISANVEIPVFGETVEGPVTSDGGSSGYYKLRITNRKGETIECEVGDVIRCMLGNDFDLGNILKALRRMHLASKGQGKAGTDIAYDVNKSKYFLDEFEHWNK